MKTVMNIKDYEVYVNLGCEESEQAYVQPVLVDIKIDYDVAVLGCVSDKLAEATDYVVVTNIIKKTATQKKYHLVEHLTHQCFLEIQNLLKQNQVSGEMALTVTKVRVPVENLKSGVSFTCQSRI
jgi:7,8-dihydroneopterin aldolase/epimerase/oxygenase